LERGANGDLWGLFFAILNMRTAEVDIHKVTSHIEAEGENAVRWGLAELTDLIGNSLADEAAELAVKLLRPPQDQVDEANREEHLAFCICIRLGMIQARIWHLFDGAPIFPTPIEDTEGPITNESALNNLIERMKLTGHILVNWQRGHVHGLKCERCGQIHQHAEFHKWKKPCVPKPTPRQLLQFQAKQKRVLAKIAMDKLVAKELAPHEALKQPMKQVRRIGRYDAPWAGQEVA